MFMETRDKLGAAASTWAEVLPCFAGLAKRVAAHRGGRREERRSFFAASGTRDNS